MHKKFIPETKEKKGEKKEKVFQTCGGVLVAVRAIGVFFCVCVCVVSVQYTSVYRVSSVSVGYFLSCVESFRKKARLLLPDFCPGEVSCCILVF